MLQPIHDLTIPFLAMYSEKNLIQKDTHTPKFIAAPVTIAKIGKQCKCPLIEEWMKKMWYINAVKYYTVEEGEGGLI